MNPRSLRLSLLLFACLPCLRAATPAPADSQDVVWTTPGKSSADSMPLSGGNLGLNVWSAAGEVCFLMASPDCMDENGRQVKLGLVRLRFAPGAFESDFVQRLNLDSGDITLRGKTASGAPVDVRIWCATNRPVIHVETVAGEPVEVTATYETWTNYAARIDDGGVRWSRRLAEVNARRKNDMKAQGLEEFADKVPDPLSGLTCGGFMTAPGMTGAGDGKGTFNGMKTTTCSLKTTAPVKRLDLCVTLRMEQDKSLDLWKTNLTRDAKLAAHDAAADRAATLAWWKAFWNRSHIAIRPGSDVADAETVRSAARNYRLIRYQYASNTSGRAMTLFNGGNFVCTKNPDSRAWDFCRFMAQNQRCSYWPFLRSGDFDMLKVATDFYRDRTEISRAHAKKFWGVDGVAWPEGMSVFGLDALGTNAEGRTGYKHLSYHHTSGMEFALMMLEMERYTGVAFPHYRDAAQGILRYYDEFYRKTYAKKSGKELDDRGCLVIYPSDACEPYHGCTNNTDVLAGLQALTRELLALPPGAIPATERTWIEGFKKRIPPFPMKEKDGKKYFAAADSWEWVMKNTNMDFPQMYVCFPFDILSLGRSDMSLAENTFELSPIEPRVQRQNHAWYQTSINFARMGNTAEAARLVLEKLTHDSERFPTFYKTKYLNGSPNFNQTPDMDHCGTARIALQEMLMQTDGKRILVGPAWPAEWSGDFKLNAPFRTVVEGRIAGGKIIVDKVTPESRRKDIEIFPLKKRASAAGVAVSK